MNEYFDPGPVIARARQMNAVYRAASVARIADETGLSHPTVQSILRGRVGQWGKFTRFAKWVTDNQTRFPVKVYDERT